MTSNEGFGQVGPVTRWAPEAIRRPAAPDGYGRPPPLQPPPPRAASAGLADPCLLIAVRPSSHESGPTSPRPLRLPRIRPRTWPAAPRTRRSRSRVWPRSRSARWPRRPRQQVKQLLGQAQRAVGPGAVAATEARRPVAFAGPFSSRRWRGGRISPAWPPIWRSRPAEGARVRRVVGASRSGQCAG